MGGYKRDRFQCGTTWLSGSVYRDTSGGRGREGTGLSIVYIIIAQYAHFDVFDFDVTGKPEIT